MVIRLKKTYFRRLLGHEMTWFDSQNPEIMTTKYAQELAVIERGTTNSVHLLIYTSFLALSGVILGFVYGW